MTKLERNRDLKKDLRDEFKIIQGLRVKSAPTNEERLEIKRISDMIDKLEGEDESPEGANTKKIMELIEEIEKKVDQLKRHVS